MLVVSHCLQIGYIYVYIFNILYVTIGSVRHCGGLFVKAQYWQETNTIDISTNKQCFARRNLLGLKLIKCNQRNWSHFKQTLKKSPLKPSARYTIDQFEKRLGWCREATADSREIRSQGHNKHQILYKQWAALI